MGVLDIILAIFLAVGFYKGYKDGLFVELASLVAFFIGIFIAVKFSYIVQNAIGDSESWSPKTLQVASFVITLLIVVVTIHLLAKTLSGIASFAFLGWANSLLGGVFGSIKTALFFGIILTLFQKMNSNFIKVDEDLQENTLLVGPCMKTSEILLPVLSDWFNDVKEEVLDYDKSEDAEFSKDTVQ
ncbi:CvpA family protein [Flavobacterium amniphilum]|uniref:CvpA family protein n=1 Tax=Flavobacterium amniphilum TaxID=1834035 RepID=UPI00202A9648|nr:CvpA family protein [Flavobacterium amniphilum]MCL9805927.1 CvpA family protein [Flavobacterium amniphilum]